MRSYIPLLLLIVLLNTTGQICIKKGVGAISKLQVAEAGRMALTLLGSGWVWLGLAVYVFSLLGWLYTLSRVELSFAYPFLSLSYLLIMLWGAFVLGEGVNAWRVAGILAICVGLFCISRSV
jgi:drug/metabolite transporter (DMT)-like permease